MKAYAKIEDYDKVVFNYFDPEKQKQRRNDVFPEDCRKAFEPGGKLVIEARHAATIPL